MEYNTAVGKIVRLGRSREKKPSQWNGHKLEWRAIDECSEQLHSFVFSSELRYACFVFLPASLLSPFLLSLSA